MRPTVFFFGALVLALAAGLGVWNIAARQPAPVPAPPQLGGPFSLTAHTGAQVTEADFLGTPTVYYFGFTYCPDVCPLSLQKLDLALEIADLGPDDVQSVLVSLDPERDTPELLAQYVASDVFPEGLVGLTGSMEAVTAAAGAFKVAFRRAEQPDSAAEYLIDHSSILYLMDEEGQFVEPFTHNDTPQDIADGLRRLVSGTPSRGARAG